MSTGNGAAGRLAIAMHRIVTACSSMAILISFTSPGSGRAQRVSPPTPAMAPSAGIDISSQKDNFPTRIWGGKFRYGAYSTLIAIHILAREFPNLVALLGKYDGSPAMDAELKRRIGQYLTRYNTLPKFTVNEIVAFAKADRTNSLYNEERSPLQIDPALNDKFIANMALPTSLAYIPQGDVISAGQFRSPLNWQFNVHRTLYDRSYGIQENSLAGLVAGYAAGLRSFEFDILNSGGTAPQSVVWHDLVTNRMTGNFNTNPVNVQSTDYADLLSEHVSVVDILTPQPSVFDTFERVMPQTWNFIHFATYVLPQTINNENINEHITLYADARNDSPALEFIGLYDQNQQDPDKFGVISDHLVTKIYHFTYMKGAPDLVNDYALKDKLTALQARSQLASIYPNILLPIGSAFSANPDTANTQYSDFGDTTFPGMLASLPFSTSSTKLNTWQGKTIFSNDDLKKIEGKTKSAAKWLFDFTAVANVLVYQLSLGNSLAYLVGHQAQANAQMRYAHMSQDDKINSAAIDNALAIIAGAKAGLAPFEVHVSGPKGWQNFSEYAPNFVWGFSDRFPDVTLASDKPVYDGSGVVINNFYFNMNGPLCQQENTSAINKRSLAQIYYKIGEVSGAWSSPVPRYITTDLETDLPAALMSVYPDPEKLDEKNFYFTAARVKSRLTPSNISGYQPPAWTQSISPKLKPDAPLSDAEGECRIDGEGGY